MRVTIWVDLGITLMSFWSYLERISASVGYYLDIICISLVYHLDIHWDHWKPSYHEGSFKEPTRNTKGFHHFELTSEEGRERNARFLLLLGDNFYPDGVCSVEDPQWVTM